MHSIHAIEIHGPYAILGLPLLVSEGNIFRRANIAYSRVTIVSIA